MCRPLLRDAFLKGWQSTEEPENNNNDEDRS